MNKRKREHARRVALASESCTVDALLSNGLPSGSVSSDTFDCQPPAGLSQSGSRGDGLDWLLNAPECNAASDQVSGPQLAGSASGSVTASAPNPYLKAWEEAKALQTSHSDLPLQNKNKNKRKALHPISAQAEGTLTEPNVADRDGDDGESVATGGLKKVKRDTRRCWNRECDGMLQITATGHKKLTLQDPQHPDSKVSVMYCPGRFPNLKTWSETYGPNLVAIKRKIKEGCEQCGRLYEEWKQSASDTLRWETKGHIRFRPRTHLTYCDVANGNESPEEWWQKQLHVEKMNSARVGK